MNDACELMPNWRASTYVSLTFSDIMSHYQGIYRRGSHHFACAGGVRLVRSPSSRMVSMDPVQEANSDDRKKLLLVVTERDILFNCPACHGELVVDRDGVGMEVPCSHCGHRLIVPPHQARPTLAEQPAVTLMPRGQVEAAVQPAPTRTFDHANLSPEQLSRRLDELKHQLKENRSQDTEMRGHVNRATMELHRLQLRLKKLQERHADIQTELTMIQARLGSGTA